MKTLYRYIASDKLRDWVHASPVPCTREDLLDRTVPVDEYFEGEEPELDPVYVEAACVRAAKQLKAIHRIDFEYEFLQENAA